jgi:hypothetical protein
MPVSQKRIKHIHLVEPDSGVDQVRGVVVKQVLWFNSNFLKEVLDHRNVSNADMGQKEESRSRKVETKG